MRRSFFIIIFLVLHPIVSSALETNLSLTFWFDTKPPNRSDRQFFEGAAHSINILKRNNIELEEKAKRNGVEIVDNRYANATLENLLSDYNIDNNFFYDLEKVQLILVVRMLINNCRVSGECSNKDAKDYSAQFVRYAKQKTNRGRNRTRRKQINNLNNTLLAAMAGGFVVATISNVMDSLSTSSSSNTYNHTNDYQSNSIKASSNQKRKTAKRVRRIRNNGKIRGVTSRQVQCHSGRDVIIYKKNGTWYRGGSGHMGHKFDSWSTGEVANYICR